MLKVLGYRGRSLVSKAIQMQTRSPYSHVAVQMQDARGAVIEAWHVGGVREIADPLEGHDSDTVIDVFSVTGLYRETDVVNFLKQELGKKYDFRSVARFLTRIPAKENGKWFCSELVVAAFRHGGLSLQAGSPDMFSPRDVCMSPYLTLEDKINVK